MRICIGVFSTGILSVNIRDAPDTVFAGYPTNPNAGYPVRAGYRIFGRIFGLTILFLVKYQINL
jgi:hypothetical protein